MNYIKNEMKENNKNYESNKNKKNNKKTKRRHKNRQTIKKHISCNKEKNKNKNKNLTLPLKYAKTIWYFSFLHLFAGIYGLINGHYIPALLSIGAVYTSTNYWKYPLHNSWRRYFDIAYIQISLYTHMYCGFYSKMRLGYFYFIIIGILSYFISYLLQKKIFLSSLFHIMVHVFGCIANVVLYSEYNK